MAKGSVELGEVAARTTHIEVACTKCERKGRYLLARLVQRLGADFPMTSLGAKLASCPRRQAPSVHERCDVYFPNLVQAMSDGAVAAVSKPETDNFDDED